MSPPALLFTPDDAWVAFHSHGLNCGPAALAAVCGLTIPRALAALPEFDAKRYTNPTMMFNGLRLLGRQFEVAGPYNSPGRQPAWPALGLARIQWGGRWTKPGVPMRARYRQTHWVGSCFMPGRGQGIFDVNALGNGTGWSALDDWARVIPPLLTADMRGADGTWWITHAVSLSPWENGAKPLDVTKSA